MPNSSYLNLAPIKYYLYYIPKKPCGRRPLPSELKDISLAESGNFDGTGSYGIYHGTYGTYQHHINMLGIGSFIVAYNGDIELF